MRLQVGTVFKKTFYFKHRFKKKVKKINACLLFYYKLLCLTIFNCGVIRQFIS